MTSTDAIIYLVVFLIFARDFVIRFFDRLKEHPDLLEELQHSWWATLAMLVAIFVAAALWPVYAFTSWARWAIARFRG